MPERSTKFPMWLRHPHYRAAVISDDYAQHGQGRTPLGYAAAPGRAAQFTPVLVHDEDTEAYYLAKGYVPGKDQAAVPASQRAGYQEYPKWVDGPSGPVLVKDAAQEAALRGPPPEPPGPSEADLEAAIAAEEAAAVRVAALRAALAEKQAQTSAETDEREALRTQAEALGIEVDGRWGVARLRQEISEARNALDTERRRSAHEESHHAEGQASI